MTVTKEVQITNDWTIITQKVALIQFVGEAYMSVGTSSPIGNIGLFMEQNEKFVHTSDGVPVWAKNFTTVQNVARIVEV